MGNETKSFHFFEMGWIVCFPKYGNKGKYLNYTVTLIDRRNEGVKSGKTLILKEILENPEFENRYPHIVGYYKEDSGDGVEFKPEYLEIRLIGTVEEFWLFLNALDV